MANFKGASGIVCTATPQGLHTTFDERCGPLIKKFHGSSHKRGSRLEDYRQEVAAYEFLMRHKHALPFSIPDLIDHGEYSNPSEDDPVAFITMSRLKDRIDPDFLHSLHIDQQHRHMYQVGRLMAALHSLPVTREGAERFPRSPFQRHLDRLSEHPMAQENADLVRQVLDYANQFTGEAVFVHTDPHPGNLFTPRIGEEITGICDFADCGIGVKEIDMPLPYYSDYEPFMEGYTDAGGKEPSEHNFAILTLYHRTRDKLDADLKLREAQESLQTRLGQTHDQVQKKLGL